MNRKIAFLFAPVGPGMANQLMSHEAWKASRSQGLRGAAKRVGSEVLTAAAPTKSMGLLDNLGAVFQTTQGISKGREYYDMLRPKTVMATLRSCLDKHAALPPGTGESLANAVLVGSGLALGGMGIAAATRGVGGMFTRLQAGRMFAELLRRHPEIKSNPKARQYFDLIVAYAPSLLRHPNAIGDFLLRQLQYPMSGIEFIKQLADLEATVSKTQRESPGSDFGKTVTEFSSKTLVDRLKPPRS